MSTSCGWECRGRYGSFRLRMNVPYLSAPAVVIHYEEALYQVYAPLPFFVISDTIMSMQRFHVDQKILFSSAYNITFYSTDWQMMLPKSTCWGSITARAYTCKYYRIFQHLSIIIKAQMALDRLQLQVSSDTRFTYKLQYGQASWYHCHFSLLLQHSDELTCRDRLIHPRCRGNWLLQQVWYNVQYTRTNGLRGTVVLVG